MNKIKLIFQNLAVLLVCFSCGKIIYTADYNFVTNKSYTPEVFIFTHGEEIPPNSILISDFDYRESYNIDFDYVKTKLQKIARDRGANIVKINEFYYNGNKNTKGANERILGSIYFNGNRNQIIEHIDSISNSEFITNPESAILYIYRKDYGTASLADIDVYLNNEFIHSFNKRDVLKIVLDRDANNYLSCSKNDGNKFKIIVNYGHTYYVIVSNTSGSISTANSIGVVFGGNYFKQVDGFQGKTEVERIQNYIKSKNKE